MKKCLWITLLFVFTSCVPLPFSPNVVVQKTPSPSQSPLLHDRPISQSPGEILQPIILQSRFPTIKSLYRWQASNNKYPGLDNDLPIKIDQITNSNVIAGLTDQQKEMLFQNGFIVLHTQEGNFADIRHNISGTGQSYYLTSDAALHAFHIANEKLVKELERVELYPKVTEITKATLIEVLSYLDQSKGTEIENETKLAAIYLSVAYKLFKPDAAIDPRLANEVSGQLRQIWEASKNQKSVMIPGYEDDFSIYRPTGPYSGDHDLESYYQGMVWLTRVGFNLKQPNDVIRPPSRVPMIITYALRHALLNGKPVSDSWSEVTEILTYINGQMINSGPIQYSLVMDQTYGSAMNFSDLEDDRKWKVFNQELESLSSNEATLSQNSLLGENRFTGDWHFFGVQPGIDSIISQNLLYDKVGTPDKPRLIPTGLDLTSFLGSDISLEFINSENSTRFTNYSDQVNFLRDLVNKQTDDDWFTDIPMVTLYMYRQLLSLKDQQYPPPLQTKAWEYKEINSILGSWVETRHKSVGKQDLAMMSKTQGQQKTIPTPAYVEPNPNIFYTLSFMSNGLVEGLKQYGITSESGNHKDVNENEPGLDSLLVGMSELANRYKKLGDIASKELTGRPLNEDDYWIIQDCLGPIECLTVKNKKENATMYTDKMPVISSIASLDESTILETGIGNADRIYVVVNIKDQLEIAQGGVYSYYEFSHAGPDAITDVEWQSHITKDPPPAPQWYDNFRPDKGSITNAVAFRVGDVLKVKKDTDGLNIRQEPHIQGELILTLDPGTKFEIQDGPILADGYRWWKVQVQNSTQSGWIAENPEWIELAN